MSIQNHRIRLRPRDDTLHVTRNRTALATDLDGYLNGGPDRGLFVHQTRLLSHYRYRIDGKPWTPLALSNVEQHSWMGYYVALAPGAEPDPRFTILGPGGTLAQQPIELRLSRFVGDGMHEDVDLTNFAQRPASFTLQLWVDADFADKDETKEPRRQFGGIARDWRETGAGVWELAFRYAAQHAFDHQGNTGTTRIERGVVLRIERAGSPPTFDPQRGVISFAVELPPRGSWHACVHCTAEIDGKILPLQPGCRSFAGAHDDFDRRRAIFMDESTQFATVESETLAPVVLATLEQARRDLAALRLYDLDHGERAWVPAAGLPIYLALFGRDTLTAAWQASLVTTDIMRGTLPELACWQGTEVNDWRDERPGKMLHQADTGPLASLNFNPLARYYG
ncbi:MAG: glycogen debranching N-terminal domain-containing protein, partial [Opitutaceae bacterium]